MVDSDGRPNGEKADGELERWMRRLDELFDSAVSRKNRWKASDGAVVDSPNPDIKGAVEVVRLALTLHGALAAPLHAANCKCPRCAKTLETAEEAVRARLKRVS